MFLNVPNGKNLKWLIHIIDQTSENNTKHEKHLDNFFKIIYNF